MKQVTLLLLFGISAALNVTAFGQSETPPGRPASKGAENTSPPPPPGQFLVEIQIPNQPPALKVTMTAQKTGLFQQPSEATQVEALHGTISKEDRQKLPAGQKILSNTTKSFLLTEGWNAQFLVSTEGDTILLRGSSRAPGKGDKAAETANAELKGSRADWAKGIAVGKLTMKITTRQPPSYLPPVKGVWALLAAKPGTTSSFVQRLPAAVLDQAAATLGFTPVILNATLMASAKSSQRTIGNIQLEDTATIEDTGIFALRSNAGSLIPTTGLFATVYRFEGTGWFGAPVFAGPIVTGKDETYVLYVEEPDSDPLGAQKDLAASRIWTAATGQTTQATYVKDENGRVTLRKADGTEIALPLAALSVYDRTLIADSKLPPPAPPATLPTPAGGAPAASPPATTPPPVAPAP